MNRPLPRVLSRHKGAIAVAAGVLLAVAIAWWSISSRRERTIRAIERAYGTASPAYTWRFPIGGRPIRFGPLARVEFRGPRVDDRSLDVLDEVPDLQLLSLVNTNVTDEGLAALSRRANLDSLFLANVDYTRTHGAPGAKWNVANRVTARGLKGLDRNARLVYLQLIGIPIDDEAARALGELKGLLGLDLKDTGVTPSALAALRRSLPRCKMTVR